MIHAGQVKVKATPTPLQLDEDSQGGGHLHVRNDGATDMFIGPSNVTASGAHAGFKVPKETTLPFPLELMNREEIPYAITASGETIAHLIRT